MPRWPYRLPRSSGGDGVVRSRDKVVERLLHVGHAPGPGEGLAHPRGLRPHSRRADRPGLGRAPGRPRRDAIAGRDRSGR